MARKATPVEPAEVQQIPVERITADASINPRAGGINPLTVAEYTADWEAGADFPSLVVYQDGNKTWLSEGFHRLEAARAAEIDTVSCLVRKGGRRDALLNAVGSNGDHGLRRSSDDKRRAVELLLADPEWAAKSNRWVADVCRVSDMLVASVRNVTGARNCTSREGLDGKTYSVTDQFLDPGKMVPHEPAEATEPDDEPQADRKKHAASVAVGDSSEAEIKRAKRAIHKVVQECVQGRDEVVRVGIRQYLYELSEKV